MHLAEPCRVSLSAGKTFVMGTDAGTATLLRYELPRLEATGLLARRLAPLLRAGDMIALKGELGVGKTTFARALIRALGVTDAEIPSPTYTLAQGYQGRTLEIWHFDLYRLRSAEDALELGIDEARRDNLVLIEWPERLGPALATDRLEISFEYAVGEDARRVALNATNGWSDRLSELNLDGS